MQKRIDVTQRDIDKGVKGSCSKCPIARAIRREFHCKSEDVLVDGIQVFAASKEMCPVPKKIKDFVAKFDNGMKVKPFSFVFKWEKY